MGLYFLRFTTHEGGVVVINLKDIICWTSHEAPENDSKSEWAGLTGARLFVREVGDILVQEPVEVIVQRLESLLSQNKY
jgi:hypothetical protein